MREDFLHYVWRLQEFERQNLQTTEGETIEVLANGSHNEYDGPDFINARLRIGGQLWAGNVEIHVKASDWYLHQHQNDPAYDNVILHVVAKEDRLVNRVNGERLPCLELHSRVPAKLLGVHRQLLNSEAWIPCQHHLWQVSELTRTSSLDRMLVERLEARTVYLQGLLEQNNSDWEETYFQALLKGFGQKVNADAFVMLGQRVSQKVLMRHRDNLRQLEALFFGQAGFLDQDFEDDYPQYLQREYRVLQAKYQLVPMAIQHWKFKQLRPANFPTIRLAQLANLFSRTGQLLAKTLAASNVEELRNMFVVELSNYWRNHYVFDQATKTKPKRLGKQSIDLLLINTIVPFLFFYGKYRQETRFQDQALALLEEIPAESNGILKQWAHLGLKAETAYQSQALLELKTKYCQQKRCTECAIGHSILKRFTDK